VTSDIPTPRAGEAVSGPAVVVGMDESLEVVRNRLREQGERFAAVRQGGRITAVVDRDRLDRPHHGGSVESLAVRDVVHPGTVCVFEDTPLPVVARLVRIARIPAIPVLDRWHRLIGLLTADDLTRWE